MNRRDFLKVLLGSSAALASGSIGSAADKIAGDAQAAALPKTSRLDGRWFLQSRYGLMISFSVYSLLKRGSWAIYLDQIPVKEYKELMHRFNPSDFDAKEWVQLAKDSGHRYITLVAKHRDGFSMFDTKLSDFSIMKSPFGRDLFGEVAAECHRQGMIFNAYYQLRDWTHPAYRESFKPGTPLSKEYTDYIYGQVRELCTNYGKLGAIWFDGGVDHTPEQWKAQDLFALIRRLQPDALIDDRTGLNGDFSTPEEAFAGAIGGLHPYGVDSSFRPPERGRLWERCVTMNDHWGYDALGGRYKSPGQVVQLLVETVAADGNLLINVAPQSNGKIDPISTNNLRAAGKWLAKNGESIYGAGFSRKIYYQGVYATQAKEKVYIHIFDWKPGTSCDYPLLGIADAKRIYFLDGDREIRPQPTPVGLRLIAKNPAVEDSPDTIVAFDHAVSASKPADESVPL